MADTSGVERLVAECQRLEGAIIESRARTVALKAERDALIRELRGLGLPERAVGRLLGISGPRVNQVMRAAGGAERPAKPVEAPAKPVSEPLRRAGPAPAAAPRPKVRRCTHPGTRSIGGFCKQCDALVLPGGGISG